MLRTILIQKSLTAFLLASMAITSVQVAQAEGYYWDQKKTTSYTAPKAKHYAENPKNNSPIVPTGSSKQQEQLVEDKAFSFLETAYNQRNREKFENLKSLFKQSFPHSQHIAKLVEFQKNFYYQEALTMEQLGHALVDMPFTKAKNLKEMKSYFAELKQRGMRAVQLEVVQLGGHKSFQFVASQRVEGYYFPSRRGIMVENLLEPVLAAAHAEGLKVYASLSLRNHPDLTRQRVLVIDESWNFLGQQTELTNKLDLFNPAGKSYLFSIVDDLVKQKIDGIIIKDDFTYGQHEGFSEEARKNFAIDTGLDLNLRKIFERRLSEDENYGLMTSKEYWSFAQWRTEELKQTLWEFLTHVKAKAPKLEIGIEVAPSMLLEPSKSMDKYATGLHYLRDLDVNFFILQWKKEEQRKLSSPKDYNHAAELLRKAVALKPILMKTPLTEETMNLILLNRRIKGQTELSQDYKNMDWAIGPVDQRQGLDFIQFVPAPVREEEDQEEGVEDVETTKNNAKSGSTAAPALIPTPRASGSTRTSATLPPKQ